ncbi:Hsp70 family protein [Endozoicomonas sp. SESOKO3]|uniref:Hsp70 family protein n=1 Tax=Endozoicomonas sp. SESOKO3 TaxID=2828744 RepID=UPI002147FCF4|nr:Hsp70 family protein [Endozoicomonas sp. SESOKO3]
MKELSLTTQPIAAGDSRHLSQHTYVGIDFGTSTTVVSIAYFDWQEKQIRTRTLELNQKLCDGAIYTSDKIPTMLAWHNDQLFVGEGANQLRLKKTKGKNIWYAFKMDLGKKNQYLYAGSELANSKMKLLNGRDATTIFFKYLYQQIQRFVRKNDYPESTCYSISIPASFEPDQRQDMLDALKANQFEFHERAFIDEPNAAFLSYISDPELQQSIHLSDEFNANLLVFDYGAGTCDISIMEIGVDNNQFRSSNLAISRFDYLGGREIDRLIANDILYPQLLSENQLDDSFFTTSEIRKYILPKLERYGEQLKIEASKALALAWDNIDLDTYENIFTLPSAITFKTRKGVYQIAQPAMNFEQFQTVMNAFTSPEGKEEFRQNKNERFVSIFNPINTALRKAKLDESEVDYVLFIGGSAKNPLIQQAVKDFLDASDYLVPRDLQAHVSKGAAINSFLYNGFNESVIAPITNEPIFLIIKQEYDSLLLENADDLFGLDEEDFVETDTSVVPIIPAGAKIPSETVVISNLYISHVEQTQIELPICLSHPANIIHNLIIPCDGATMDDAITLQVSIDANRTVHAKAKLCGQTKSVSLKNALHQPTTAKERVAKVEEEHSKAVSENQGRASEEELYKLYQFYKREGESLKAAEVAEDLYKQHNKLSLNNIGLLYSDAGDREKAIHYYQKHLERTQSAAVLFNLACEYQYTDIHQYLHYLHKALEVDPHHGLARYSLLKHQLKSNPSNKELLVQLFDEWKADYEADQFSYHISWLISCARLAGNYEFVRKLQKTSADITADSTYNRASLATAKKE